MVAVKKIENVFDHRSLAKRTLRELKLVRTFNHENILGLDRVMRPHSNTFHNIYLCSEVGNKQATAVRDDCTLAIVDDTRGAQSSHASNLLSHLFRFLLLLFS